MDQGPPQYSASWFLMFHAGVALVPTWDPAAHRMWNGCKLALKDAKLMGALITSNILFNYKSGPWSTSAWHKQTTACILDLQATLTPNDPLLMKLWAGICADHGWLSESDTNESARERYIASLHMTKVSQTKGEQVAICRWLSWHHHEVGVWVWHRGSAFHLELWGWLNRSELCLRCFADVKASSFS